MMGDKQVFEKFASEREAALSDAKDSNLVSVNLFTGSVMVYKPTLAPRGIDVPSCYPLGNLGKLRAAPKPILLVSSARAFIFVAEPPQWNYAAIADPSLPSSVQVDTRFFPEATAEESAGEWRMTLATHRWEKMDDIRNRVCRTSHFVVAGTQLFSPASQNITSIVESFSADRGEPLRIFVTACWPNQAVTRMTLAELKRLERAVSRLDFCVDVEEVIPDEPFL